MRINPRFLIACLTAIVSLTAINGYCASAKKPAKKNGLNAVCSNIQSFAGVKYKANPSDHITSGSRVNGISLIFAKGTRIPSSSCLTVFDKAGQAIGRLGMYEVNGAIFGARYYSGTGCAPVTTASSMARQAKSTGSPSIYIQTGPGTCLAVSDASRDQGSVS